MSPQLINENYFLKAFLTGCDASHVFNPVQSITSTCHTTFQHPYTIYGISTYLLEHSVPTQVISKYDLLLPTKYIIHRSTVVLCILPVINHLGHRTGSAASSALCWISL